MLVSIAVVAHRNALNSLLDIRHLDGSLDTRDGFKSSEGATSITSADAYEMVQCCITHSGGTSKAARVVQSTREDSA